MGQSGNLEVDVNFMYRVPLWAIQTMASWTVGSYAANDIPILDKHELAAGKLTALFSRNSARDLFDAHKMLLGGGMDVERLRVGFVVYGAMSRRDWREVGVRDVRLDPEELAQQLIPMLRKDALAGETSSETWADRLMNEAISALDVLLPLSEAENEFLYRLLDEGEIAPRLLTDDRELAGRIERHPSLQWKALHVRKHRREN